MGAVPPQERKPDYGNHEKVLGLLARVREDAVGNTAVQERRRQDMKNLLFDRGGADNQHIVWSNTGAGQWLTRPYEGDLGLAAWIPRIATNHFSKKVNGVASLLSQSNPAKTAVPATDDERDLAAAEVARNAIPVLEEEIGYPRLRAELNAHVTLTSTVAVNYFYDASDKYGVGTLPGFVCTDPACPQPGQVYDAQEVEEAGQLLDESMAAAPMEVPDAGMTEGLTPTGMDSTPPAPGQGQGGTSCPTCGGPVTEQADAITRPIGRLRAEVCSTFEHTLPSSAKTTDVDFLPWVFLHSSADEITLCGMYPQHAAKIREAARSDQKNGDARHLARQMQRLASPFSGGASKGGGAQEKAGPMVYRVQHDPVVDDDYNFPEGLSCVVLGDDLVLEAGPLPVLDPLTQKRRKSILIRTYEPKPGTAFGKPIADDLVPIQEQRNHYEMLGFMILMHHASPRTFIPADVVLIDQITGVPGQDVRFQSMSGASPVTVPGSNIPPSLPLMIEACDKAMDQLSGLNAVLGGERPDGDPTLGEIQILQERGMSAMRAPMDEQASFEQKQARLLLDLGRQTAWSPRFRRIQGENGQWALKAFTGADLEGNLDIVIEPMSTWPKSTLMQQMKLEKAVELGAIQPAADPEIALAVVKELGITEVKPSLDEDRRQVARELDRWKAARTGDEIAPPNLPVINVPVHHVLKKGFLKTEEAEAIQYTNPAVWHAMVGHVQQLGFAMAPPPAAAAPGGAGPAGEEQPPSTHAVDAAVQAGVLQPADQGGDAMNDAVSSGVLVEEGAALQQQQAAGPSIDDMTAAQVLTPLPFNEGTQP